MKPPEESERKKSHTQLSEEQKAREAESAPLAMGSSSSRACEAQQFPPTS